jgi:hypothetical protein
VELELLEALEGLG